MRIEQRHTTTTTLRTSTLLLVPGGCSLSRLRSVASRVNITFLNPKFQKPIEECHTFYEKWLFVLQNLTRLMERPKELQDRVFKKLFEQAEIAKYTADEYDAYEDSLINLWDLANSNEAAEKKGIKIGMEKGEKIGIEKGRKEGRAEGELQAKLALARSMKADNMPVETIAKYTGLSINEINNL